MVLVASPQDESWMDSCTGAFRAMEDAGGQLVMEALEIHHRRGSFPAINVGISYGQGPKRPHNLDNGPHSELMQALLKNEHIRRLAIFASGMLYTSSSQRTLTLLANSIPAAFSVWAPDLYAHYKINLDAMLNKMPGLQRNFDKSIFACSAFNFGPAACTCAHRDCMNCPFGWCAIQALGVFDHTGGGHLVLDDLKLVIEFPVGSLILLPSAVLAHANTTIQPGERRASFTQFTAGDLFRFVDNNFKTEESFRKSVSKKVFTAKMKEKETRWELGLEKWSTVEDLLARVQQGVNVVKEEHQVLDRGP